eukprot:9481569-Pyramimonas_sp.AAC.1
MSSAEPTDHDIFSEHIAGIMSIQAKKWLSAEATAQPFVSQSMGSQEGALGRTEDRIPSERTKSTGASTRRQNPLDLPGKKASDFVFEFAEGDSSVDS